MIKKILALVLALSLVFSVGTALAYNDTAQDPELNRAVNMLSSLNIVSGMGDGGYHPYENLTRAQFSKIAVYLMGQEENAVSTSVPFMDVPAGHWATGYIGLVSNSGIIAGYPNGTFGADEEITYGQAVTVVVRTLGFSGEDVGYRWPDGYVEKAQAIGLLDGITISDVNSPITRGDAAKLCYNALFCDMKTGGELISMRKVTRAEDVVIIADSATDVSLTANTVKTSAGNFRIAADSSVPENIVGTKGDLYYDNDGDIVVYAPDQEIVRTLIVTSTLMNSDTNRVEINYTEDGQPGRETFALSHPVYNEGAPLTVGSSYQLMSEGSELKLFYDDRGGLQRGVLSTSTMLGPVTVDGDGFSALNEFNIADASDLRVIRKGLSASLDDVERFDVLYYAENTNTLYAYDDKVTGIYEEAMPIKANVTSIVLSGVTYPLATQTAINKLNESPGAFSINDRVTLLKGKSGEIVDAVDTDVADLQSYGVVQNAYVQISDSDNSRGRGDYRVTMFMGDGTMADYVCDKDYSEQIGDFCRLVFKGGVLTLEKVTYNKITGSFDKSRPSLAGHWFSNDFGIIELVSLPENGPATLRKVSLNEISTSALTASEVIHAQTTGSMGDISILYVKGLTNEQYTYGVITNRETPKGVNSDAATKTFTLLLGSAETKITNNYAFKPGDAIAYGPGEDGSNKFIDLLKVAQGSAITAKTSNRIRLDDKIYTISDSAVAYGGDYPVNYRALSLDELVDMKNVKSVALYSDRALSGGGDVKVIIVTTY
ncbi:MAG: S-layer homology domain-containing protein [Oscillospiraceae bacterium]|nr:S-layer homology domain-containing protein [Oscillospiraceae bacterium]